MIVFIFCIGSITAGNKANLIARAEVIIVIHHGKPVRSWNPSSNETSIRTGRIDSSTVTCDTISGELEKDRENEKKAVPSG